MTAIFARLPTRRGGRVVGDETSGTYIWILFPTPFISTAPSLIFRWASALEDASPMRKISLSSRIGLLICHPIFSAETVTRSTSSGISLAMNPPFLKPSFCGMF